MRDAKIESRVNQLTIALSGRAQIFEPGQRVAGSIRWDLEEVPDQIELRLLWRTSGEAAPEVHDVHCLDWDGLEARGERSFELDLPSTPPSLQGRFFALQWFLQMVVPGRDHREELPIEVVAPGTPADWSELRGAPEVTPLQVTFLDPAVDFGEESFCQRTNRARLRHMAFLLALLCFCWNGLLYSYAFGVGPVAVAAPIWSWVFLFPLAIVGLLWLLMFGSAMLSLLAPDPELRSDGGEWVAGESASFGWTLRRGTLASKPWRITLEAREEVETRAGNTKGRGERCFFRGLVAEFPDLESGAVGACTVTVPAGALPSFEGEHVAVRWHLRFAQRDARAAWNDLPWMNKEFEVRMSTAPRNECSAED